MDDLYTSRFDICRSAWLIGAQRTIRLVTAQWVHTRGALPITTDGSVQLSPYNPLSDPGQGGSATARCTSRRQETHDITTFCFRVPPGPGGQIFCEAGQFASFDFPYSRGYPFSRSETLNRTWTISSSPREVAGTGEFSISVKKVGSRHDPVVKSACQECCSEREADFVACRRVVSREEGLAV